MTNKQRLSASVDAELIEQAHAAVAAGRAENVSAWVNEALRRQTDHEQRLVALAELIAAYEAEHGEITPEEMERAERRMKERAIVVHGNARRRKRRGAA